jgi:hypothetical protein
VVKKYAGNMTSGVRPLGGDFSIDALEGRATSSTRATKTLVSAPKVHSLPWCRLIDPPASGSADLTPGVTFYTLRTNTFDRPSPGAKRLSRVLVEFDVPCERNLHLAEVAFA